jgi:hypothetical protein
MAACPDDGPIAPPIVLSDMIQRREIRTVAEDWTGTTDSARRRKLQNRLNQRAYGWSCFLSLPICSYNFANGS